MGIAPFNMDLINIFVLKMKQLKINEILGENSILFLLQLRT